MARYDDMAAPHGVDDADSDDEMAGAATHKAKPRRKSHQRPQGSDQIRQAFSKRKKGLVLKAYQLSALTDAKVFMFIVNDKGTSWAYATPGFAASLNPELLKEMRQLAQVPEQAKIITEVMPDPPNVRQLDASAPEQLTQQQMGAAFSAPCTRTATGALPARSRSSYSGGSGGGEAGLLGPDAAPLAWSGSTTTTTRMASAAHSEEASPTKPRARPPSGSSMAGGGGGGRLSSFGGSSQQQQPRGRLLGGMEPPTPCGVTNLQSQPITAHTESPTVISEVAASSSSPSSRQLAVAAAAGLQAQLDPQAADELVAGLEQQQQCWQQQQQQQLQSGMQWLVQQQPQAGWNLGMVEQKQLLQPQYAGAPPSFDAGAAAACWGAPPSQQLQPQGSAPLPGVCGNADTFESMQRGLPPLRLGRGGGIGAGGGAPGWREAEGAPHSAPAGAVNGLLGPPSDWMEFELGQAKPENLRVLSDAGCYGAAPASSSGYSSFRASPSCGPRQGGSPGDAAAAGPAPAFMMAHEGVGADPSPTAALSRKMCSVLAMESPAQSPQHATQQQQQQQAFFAQPQQAAAAAGWQCVDGSGYVQDRQLLQVQLQQDSFAAAAATAAAGAHNQGAYMPITDDLVCDPLMDMLMDQAQELQRRGPPAQLPPPQQQQQQQPGTHSHGTHISIMDATLQQPPPQVLLQQQRQQAQQQGQYGGFAAGTQQQQQQQQQQQLPQLVHVASMLDHLPVPRKHASDAEKVAWREQVRQMVDMLPPAQRSEFLSMVSDRMAAEAGTYGNTGSNNCSPVLPPASAPPAAAVAPRVCAPGPGGKQRHGPSRLSASSPAIEPAAAGGAAAGMDAFFPPGACRAPDAPCSTLMLAPEAAVSAPLMPAPGVCVVTTTPAAGAAGGTQPCGSTPMEVAPGCCGMVLDLGDDSGMLPVPQPGAGPGAGPPSIACTGGAPATDAAPVSLSSLGEALAAGGGAAGCSSPLKRGALTSFGLLAALGECEDGGSPLKRACRELPEPPSFATLLRTTAESEDDAVAWAAAAAGSDSMALMAAAFAGLERDMTHSGSLPAFVTVGGSEAVAAAMQAEEDAAAREAAVQAAQQGAGAGAAERPQGAPAAGEGEPASARPARVGLQLGDVCE